MQRTFFDEDDEILTCEEVFVDARELNVGFCGARDDQTVDDAFRDTLGHRMPQQALNHHGTYVREQRRLPRAREIREGRVLQRRRGCRREAEYLARPAVNRALELRCCVLCAVGAFPKEGGERGERGRGER